MDADEKSRSRQYFCTAMSDDEVSKVPEIKAFGIFAKSYIRDRGYYQSFNFTQNSDYIVICTLRCVLFRQSDNPICEKSGYFIFVRITRFHILFFRKSVLFRSHS